MICLSSRGRPTMPVDHFAARDSFTIRDTKLQTFTYARNWLFRFLLSVFTFLPTFR